MTFQLLFHTLIKIGVRSFIKSVRFNIKYFGIKNGIQLPIFVSKNVVLNKTFGSIKLHDFSTGIIRIGFGNVGIFDKKYDRTVLEFCKGSTIRFNGKADIGHGSKISVQNGAKLSIGKSFCVTANSSIICTKQIEFGDHCLLSWDILMMDSDLHQITDDQSCIINQPKSIIVGNNVWIGAKSTILKGVEIGAGNVIGANSLVNKSFCEINSVIAGAPAKVIKTNISWKR